MPQMAQMPDRADGRKDAAGTRESSLAGFKKLFLPRPHARSMDSELARALFEQIPKGLAAESRVDLVTFLGRVALFEDLR